MKHIKRLIFVSITLVVLIAVVTVVWIDRLAKAGVESGGSYAFGVPTMLDSANIGILSGRSKLSGLNIANPEGFDTPYLLKLGDSALAVSFGSLTGDTVEIPEFSLTGIDVNLESKGTKANFKTVLDNLGRFESSKKEPQARSEGKKFIIREIVVKDVKVNLSLLPFGGSATRVTVPIDELRLKDIGTGSDKGVVLAEVAGTLLKAIIQAAIEKGRVTIPGDLLNQLNGAMASLAPLKDIGATLAVNMNGALKDLTAQTGTIMNVGNQAAAVGQQFTQQAQGATQQLTDTAKVAQQSLKGGFGGLLGKKETKSN